MEEVNARKLRKTRGKKVVEPEETPDPTLPWFIFLTPTNVFGGEIKLAPSDDLPASKERTTTRLYKYAARFATRREAVKWASYSAVPGYRMTALRCPEAPPPPKPREPKPPRKEA